jgi:hypothetical protein
MKKLNIRNLSATVLAAVVLGAFVIGCGGGGSNAPDPINNPDPGNGAIAGGDNLSGNIQVGLPEAGFKDGAVPGASIDAPLGLDMTYSPVIAGVETSKSSSRSASALNPGDDLAILKATISPFDVTPDYEATNIVVKEGQLVTLWVEYEVSGQAPGVGIHWFSAETEIDYGVPFIATGSAGVYTTKFTVTVPVGSAGAASYDFTLDYGKNTSLVVGPNLGGPDAVNVPFTIEPNNPNTEEEYEPPTEGDDPECLSHNSVAWSIDKLSVTVTSDKELSNVILQFEDWTEQKFDDLDQNPQYVGTFSGTGNNAGKRLRGVWVKAGCNGDHGYGQYFANNITGHNIMVWEDLIQNSDYDYNDFVSSMYLKEIRDGNGDLIEINLEIKALARGAGYDHDWQFNIASAFPGATCVATIDQYYANNTRHGAQRIWNSTQGVSIPVFISSKQALPAPPGYWATNAFNNQPIVNGDYAIVKIQFSTPMKQGSYTSMPYQPELRVKPGGGNTYIVRLWTRPGDYIDSNGRPLAFIVPNTYAWPAEGVKIWNVYPGFNAFANWANGSAGEPTVKFWNLPPVTGSFTQSTSLINSVEFITN